MWKTGWGVAILIKIAILVVAMAVASVNLLRTRPAIVAQGDDAPRAARTLRGLVGVETVLVVGAIFVAAILTSLAPPPPSFALQNSALAGSARAGPSRPCTSTATTAVALVSPNRPLRPTPGTADHQGRQAGPGADGSLTFNHTEMQMPQQSMAAEQRPGVYSRSTPALVMVGRWALGRQITPLGGQPFTALILDQAAMTATSAKPIASRWRSWAAWSRW